MSVLGTNAIHDTPAALTPLSVDLVYICDPLGEQVWCDWIAVLVLELCGLGTCLLDLRARVGNTSGHDTSNLLCEFENVRDSRGLQQLVLRE